MGEMEKDTVGGTNSFLGKQREEERTEKTIFVTTTDSMENARWEYTHKRLKAVIRQ